MELLHEHIQCESCINWQYTNKLNPCLKMLFKNVSRLLWVMTEYGKHYMPKYGSVEFATQQKKCVHDILF